MRVIEDHCCGCATENYPCRGKRCPNVNVVVYYCDHCKDQIDGDIYEVEGEHLCEECLHQLFIKKDED